MAAYAHEAVRLGACILFAATIICAAQIAIYLIHVG
jgi:hypothetical protein